MHDLMHDLTRLVSENECARMDGSDPKEILPTIRHLSIITDSYYYQGEYGFTCPNDKFEKQLYKDMAVKVEDFDVNWDQ